MIVVITGMSGAGKTEAVRRFEDLGYFCVDNMPPALIPKFAELCAQTGGRVSRSALVSDIRGGQFFDHLFDALEELERSGFQYRILFLEASDEALVRRFKKTRRPHPLAEEGRLLEGIKAERRRLSPLRGRAHHVIDTSLLAPRELSGEIDRLFAGDVATRLTVTVVSFGFKYGLPLDADLVFDVRFLPNPYYVPQLSVKSGQDPEVAEYVAKWPVAQRFLAKWFDLMDFLMPQFLQEGRSHLVVGIGCTGGRHRSVALSDRLAQFLCQMGYSVTVEHRDIAREAGAG